MRILRRGQPHSPSGYRRDGFGGSGRRVGAGRVTQRDIAGKPDPAVAGGATAAAPAAGSGAANDRVAAVFAMKDVLADIDAIAARVQQGRLTGQPGRPARKTTKSDVD